MHLCLLFHRFVELFAVLKVPIFDSLVDIDRDFWLKPVHQDVDITFSAQIYGV